MPNLSDLHGIFEKFVLGGHLPAFLTGAFVSLVFSLTLVRILLARDPRRGRSQVYKERCEQLELKLEEKERAHASESRAAQALAAGEVARGQERVDALAREVRLLEGRVAEVTASRDEARAQKAELSGECERMKAEGLELSERLRRERAARKQADERALSADRELAGVLNSDAKLWDRAVGDPPRFRPLSLRSMPILSVVNLKGGVGKTTITANLGFALARLGCRVLLVDLDYQGSLTSRCATDIELEDLRASRRLIQDVFEDDADDRCTALMKILTRLSDATGGGEVHLAGADDLFEAVESGMMMRWHVGATGDDVRFRLRQALHHPAVEEKFDVVLLDCPPRLTAGCINALTSSDYALIPVLMDEASAEAVPRLLSWLKKLRPGVFPDLSVLGVVGNKAFPRTKLIAREQTVWTRLAGHCEAQWGRPVRLFDEAIIRQHSSPEHRIAALCPKHHVRYANLAEAILKELRPHVRRRSPGLPPFARPAAQGVGG